MDKETMKNILLAVVETLNAVELRTEQVRSAAKIHACAGKLAEVVEALNAEEVEAHEAENKPGA